MYSHLNTSLQIIIFDKVRSKKKTETDRNLKLKGTKETAA